MRTFIVTDYSKPGPGRRVGTVRADHHEEALEKALIKWPDLNRKTVSTTA